MTSFRFLLGALGLVVSGWCGAAEWQRLAVPGAWEQKGAGAASAYDGPAWYRAWVLVPERFFGRHSRNLWEDSISLNLRDVADAHVAYANGVKLGAGARFASEGGASLRHRHKVPMGTLRPGWWNEIAIRVENGAGPGGFLGEAPFLMNYDTELELAGQWEFLPTDDYVPGKGRPDRPPVAAFDESRPSTRVLGRSPQRVPGPRLPPAESHALVRSADDLVVDLLLHEPLVAQPTHLSFDEKGRLWVTQYRQYPYPAGLTMTSRSSAYEATYDRVPPPPPGHDRGADRITIHEDTDGDGRYDRHRTFQDGLNLAVAAVRGRGGAWVLHPPYLLFYPDADFDDTPDGPPVVHLQGFGLEDTHAVANGLIWGPDGWLYGGQGSTTSSRVTRPGVDPPDAPGIAFESSMVWRYHPKSRRYEIFAKGGGNTFGLEFDADGRLFAGHNGGQTRGWYFPPGGRHLIRSAAMQPAHTYGELPFMRPLRPVPRFSHFSAYVGATALPARYQGHLFALDPLVGTVIDVVRSPHGASFTTQDAGRVVWNSDVAFRPIHLVNAPDGSLVLADLYEYYIAHGQHYQSQIDPESGRVYRLRGRAEALESDYNLHAKTSAALTALLRHSNLWHRHTAVRLLGERRDPATIGPLRELLAHEAGRGALTALWTLHQMERLRPEDLETALAHPYGPVRMWAVRLLGENYGVEPQGRDPDPSVVPARLAGRLEAMAQRDPDPEVRAQIAITGGRLAARFAVPLLLALVARGEDAEDPFVPHLLWWSWETHLQEARDALLAPLTRPATWRAPLWRRHLLSRMMRRDASEATPAAWSGALELLRLAPSPEDAEPLLEGLELALVGRNLDAVPAAVVEAALGTGRAPLALRLRRGEGGAVAAALARVADRHRPVEERRQLIALLGETRPAVAEDTLLTLATGNDALEVRQASVHALGAFDSEAIARRLVPLVPGATGGFRSALLGLLASRPSWSAVLLDAIEAGRLPADTVPAEFRVQLRSQAGLPARSTGENAASSAAGRADPAARVAELELIVAAGPGQPSTGARLFAESCASCHTAFGRGGALGPDLTGLAGRNLSGFLLSIVQPDAEIREGFEYHELSTRDGRTVAGFIVRQDSRTVVLRGLGGAELTVARPEIVRLTRLERSLMPAGLLDRFTAQEVRDLFSYLRSNEPSLPP